MNKKNKKTNKEIIDERIVSEKHKYGYQAFVLMFFLTTFFLYIAIFRDKSLFEILSLLSILVIPSIYYTIRKVKSGIYTISSNKNDLKKSKKKAIIEAIMATIVFSLLQIFFSNKDMINILLMSLVFCLFYYLANVFFINKSYKKSTEMIDKNESE